VLDHLSRQFEPIGTAHAFGEHLHDGGQTDHGAADFTPQLEVGVPLARPPAATSA